MRYDYTTHTIVDNNGSVIARLSADYKLGYTIKEMNEVGYAMAASDVLLETLLLTRDYLVNCLRLEATDPVVMRVDNAVLKAHRGIV